MEKILIIGKGLLGSEIEKQALDNNLDVKIKKNITSQDNNIIPENTDTVIIVAQSSDYKENKITENLFWVNTCLPQIIIREALEKNVKNFVYCSTGSVYDESISPHLEDESISLFNKSPYITSKKAAEILIYPWIEKFERFIILRPFFIYGSKQRKEMLISKMFSAVETNGKITLSDSEGLIFNPIHVIDAARFTLESIDKKTGYDIYNLAGNETTSLYHIVDKISKLLKKSANIENVEGKKPTVTGSIKKMVSTGFKFEINLEKGLKECLNK